MLKEANGIFVTEIPMQQDFEKKVALLTATEIDAMLVHIASGFPRCLDFVDSISSEQVDMDSWKGTPLARLKEVCGKEEAEKFFDSLVMLATIRHPDLWVHDQENKNYYREKKKFP